MPRILLAAGGVLLFVAAVLAAVVHGTASTTTDTRAAPPVHITTAQRTPTPPPPPPPPVAMSWQAAGALVVHPSSVDPAQLGREMRDAGFGWVAVDLASLDSGWIARLRAASGLAVGGWSVLGADPQVDATDAAELVKQYGLAFYIADAEQPYGYTDGTTKSTTRFARSHAFVTTFRAAEPGLPAAVTSYCRADRHDLDWSAWASAGFDFLPQAYVNDFGSAVSPRVCVNAAAKWFPPTRVHPTIGSYSGLRGIVSPSRWVALLRAAHASGFSIYPAEAGMSPENWRAYGTELAGLAQRPQVAG
jgi:hypothetical protein